MTITRFAPSPTGFLHVGNLRTALINFLIAKKNNGTFILRLDDTDPVRSKTIYVDQIKRDLEWLGLEWDRVETQSSRIERYKSVVSELKRIDRLYEAFETPIELELKRKKQLNLGQPPVYDRSALNITSKELKKIKNQGYAFDDEEWFNGMVGLSVPIFNSENELCFCLSTHTAKSRKDINDLKKILSIMLSSANNLKKVLFKD